ncbi:TetR/AcrR family transcriptional regulator [Herbivorax sp. ANBcel31]|uniref:TetR/AcrR family transcriptional regulator n=1 Tax=Herbivorax sp. ANBcel31 TaxID=3069754 RepID=UPI0027AF017E|nr:TetR/AcrR family transcriptional regulator [Herbivorax sp. ANBcel31]MDQ2086653.1 TetR/AcrR family transcriptional regulator [Herbivorax sp. ANBcel31]
MNGFDKRKKEKMKCIIDTAFDMFNDYGINNVKIVDVAKKANVSKVTIYNYFGSKEELVKQVFFDFVDKNLEKIKKLMESELNFKEKLERFYDFKMDIARNLSGKFFNYIINSYSIMQEYTGDYYEKKLKPVFMSLVVQGKKEGDIDKNLSNEAILIYIEAFKGILSKPMDTNLRVDLGKLFYYGFKGK